MKYRGFALPTQKTLQLRIGINSIQCLSRWWKNLFRRFGASIHIHSLRVKGNNHLQVLDARAQSGRSRMEKRGFSPPAGSHQSEKEAIFGATKNAQRRRIHQPEAWIETLYFFFFFSVHFRSDSVDRRSKTSLRGQRPPPPPFPGWMVLWDLATFAGLFNLIPTEWDRFDTEVIVLAERKGGGGLTIHNKARWYIHMNSSDILIYSRLLQNLIEMSQSICRGTSRDYNQSLIKTSITKQSDTFSLYL